MIKKKYNIFLTGSRGFIGTHLQKRLKELGHYVMGFDIKKSEAQDIRYRTTLRKAFENFKKEDKMPDIIIHLAALAGVRSSLERPANYFETNIIGTYWLLEMAEKHGIKNFLFASSSSVYGEQKERKLKEDMICDNQLSPYAFSKKAGELLCRMFNKVPTTVFRPFTVYGERGRKDMVIYKIIKAAKKKEVFYKYGEGNSTRGYTNVHDLVEGIIKLIDYKLKDNYDEFNLGGSEEVSLSKLIDIVKKEFPDLKVMEVEKNSIDLSNSVANISKAKRLLNWQPKRKDFRKEIIKLCKLAKQRSGDNMII